MTDSERAEQIKADRTAFELAEEQRIAAGAPPEPIERPKAIDLMNARYAWIESIGKIVALDGDHIEYRKTDAFKTTHNNNLIDGEPIGSWWLTHTDRNSYRNIGLWAPPKMKPENSLNLWRGFAVKPKKGDWSKMKAHIEDVICDGDKVLAEYFIRWTAWMFQNPGLPAEAALVMRGEEGTGKGMFGSTLKTIFGRHAVQVTNPKHFVSGQFNAHMAECIFFFADECYWAGDRSHEGVLKGLITEHEIRVEPKGVDSYPVDNLLHTLISSNNEWVVPAGIKARRFVVTDVSASKLGDRGYFDDLVFELEHGGREAMLFDLLEMDLGDWHPRMTVDSEALRKQKEHSLTPEGEWVLGIVRDADLPGSGPWVSTAALQEHAREAIPKGNWTGKRISYAMRAIAAQPHCNGTRRGWLLPTLSEARAAWCASYYAREWDDRKSW